MIILEAVSKSCQVVSKTGVSILVPGVSDLSASTFHTFHYEIFELKVMFISMCISG